MRRCAQALLIVALGGCGEDTSSHQAPAGRGLGSPATSQSETVVSRAKSRITPRPLPPLAGAPSETEESATGSPPPARPQAGLPTPNDRRDLAAELRTRVGDPSSCFSAEPDRNEGIELVVTVQVVESGRVTRAEVSGGNLSREELACVRARAEAVQLRGPVSDAPRSVSTAIQLRWTPATDAPE